MKKLTDLIDGWLQEKYIDPGARTYLTEATELATMITDVFYVDEKFIDDDIGNEMEYNEDEFI